MIMTQNGSEENLDREYDKEVEDYLDGDPLPPLTKSYRLKVAGIIGFTPGDGSDDAIKALLKGAFGSHSERTEIALQELAEVAKDITVELEAL